MNDDLISRSELRARFQEILDRGDMFCEYDIIGMLDNAPTVEFPESITIKCDTEEDKQELLSAFRNAKLKGFVEDERPTGHWVEGTQGYYCSECETIDRFYFEHDFCGKCGADMRGGREC